MFENQKLRPGSIIGPLGEQLTLETLPVPGTQRWVVRRKAEVVAAVQGGLLTFDEACVRYDLTLEELASWDARRIQVRYEKPATNNAAVISRSARAQLKY